MSNETGNTTSTEPYWLADDIVRLGASHHVETVMRFAEQCGADTSSGADNRGEYLMVSEVDGVERCDELRVALTLAGFMGPGAAWDSINGHYGPEFWTWSP